MHAEQSAGHIVDEVQQRRAPVVAIDLIQLDPSGQDQRQDQQGCIRAFPSLHPDDVEKSEWYEEQNVGDHVSEKIQDNERRLELFLCGYPLDVLPVRVADEIAQGKNADHEDEYRPHKPEQGPLRVRTCHVQGVDQPH